MRQLPISSDRLDIVKFFIEGLGQHLSCYRRRLLLDIVPTLLHNFSREFFVEQFLPAILKVFIGEYYFHFKFILAQFGSNI